MGLMDIAKRIGDRLGKRKPLATALLIVFITVVSVGLLSYAFSGHHGKQDARFGPGMHGRLGGPQAGNATFGGMPPMPIDGQAGMIGMPGATGKMRMRDGFGGQPPQFGAEGMGTQGDIPTGVQQAMTQTEVRTCTCT